MGAHPRKSCTLFKRTAGPLMCLVPSDTDAWEEQASRLLSRFTEIGSSAVSVPAGGGKLDKFDKLKG